ncbi:MAG: permease, partial [Bacteroidota bacterium]
RLKHMQYIQDYIDNLVWLTNDMAPYLLLGFFIAGLLYAYIPPEKLKTYLGGRNLRSVINASAFGVPLPLCSCGVIPTGVSFYKNGASKGSSVSFLVSTPQTGIDSILVTYSMLGLPFAIVRPFIAFITGIVGGLLTNKFTASEVDGNQTVVTALENTKNKRKISTVFRYGFYQFLADIAKWLVIGLLLAALIAVVVPDDFFASTLRYDFLGMLIILAASVPLYVCATSSVPIAAVLIMKGLSPGAALIFLMAGPATNAATMTVIGKTLGKKTLSIYLATIIVGSLVFGFLLDYLIPREIFLNAMPAMAGEHQHHLLPEWLKIGSSILFTGLILNVFVQQWLSKRKKKKDINDVIKVKNMSKIVVGVKGMTCNHCKMNVENNLKKTLGIEAIDADINNGVVTIDAESVDYEKIKETVEGIGYTYTGKK